MSNNNTPPAVTDVFTAGYELDDAGTTIAKYWKNSEAHTLGTGVNGSLANAIAVSGNDVYVAGIEGNGVQDVAKYWKNGVAVELTDPTNRGFANSIFVSGSDVYVAGGEQVIPTTIAKYWKNGNPVSLPDLGKGALANSIFVSGADVYVAGWVFKTTQLDPTHFRKTDVAAFWKNGVLTTLADGLTLTVAQSIFVAGGNVYVAGFACQDNGPSCALATYWKNGTKVQLSDTRSTGASSIFVSGADVYVAGNQLDSFGEAWKNQLPLQLTGTSERSAANQIAVSGGDVYVGGALVNNSAEPVATYWKNGTPVSITDGTHFATAFALTVVKH
jgi:hypothetical protein